MEKKYTIIDLQDTDWLAGAEWTEKEIVDYFRDLVKDGASDIDYEENKELIDSDKFNMDFIADFWQVEFVEVK